MLNSPPRGFEKVALETWLVPLGTYGIGVNVRFQQRALHCAQKAPSLQDRNLCSVLSKPPVAKIYLAVWTERWMSLTLCSLPTSSCSIDGGFSRALRRLWSMSGCR